MDNETLITKKRISIFLLSIFLIWPLIHTYLVFKYEINPWKFFGWSMYISPSTATTIKVIAKVNNKNHYLEPKTSTQKALLKDHATYSNNYGKFYEPNKLVEEIIQKIDKKPDAIKIIVEKWIFSPHSTSYKKSTKEYTYNISHKNN